MLKKKRLRSASTLICGFLFITLEAEGSLQALSVPRKISRILSQNLCHFDKIKNDSTANDVDGTNSIGEYVQIFLYNRLVPGGIIINDPFDLNATNFNGKNPTKFVTHGFGSGGDEKMPQTIKDAYINKREMNIFILDWKAIAANIFYPCVTSKLDEIAEFVAEYLKRFIKKNKINPKKIHLVGHSLGAHLFGKTGKIMGDNDLKIGRITGLDPACPGFYDPSGSRRLSRTDAEFVDVIHTSLGTYGTIEVIGHVDIYPNRGRAPMPGCSILFKMVSCSHSRSWEYFAESISNPIISIKCDSWRSFQKGNCSQEFFVLSDDKIPKGVNGTYYCRTSGKSPYSLGVSGLQ